MTFVGVIASGVAGALIRVRMITVEGTAQDLFLDPDVALRAMLAIRLAISALPPHAELDEATLFRLRSCEPLQTSEGELGLSMTTQEGFRFPLLLDCESLAVLRDGLDQLQALALAAGPPQ